MSLLSNLLEHLPNFSQLLPATAVIAITVFVTKECIEWRRRSAADNRKLRAIRMVLARECELNYHSVTSLSDTLEDMKMAGVDKDASRISVSEARTSGYVVQINAGKNSSASVLRGVHRDALLKHLVDIAMLDERFYAKCESALDDLAEADHVYQSLVHGPPIHFPSTPENYYEGVIDYGVAQLSRSTDTLKTLYFACKGSELKRGRLR